MSTKSRIEPKVGRQDHLYEALADSEGVQMGWVKFDRADLRNGMLKNHNLWVFWSYCKFKATYKEQCLHMNNEAVLLKPGQFIFGRMIAAQETGLSEQTVRTCVKTLVKIKRITVESTNKFSVITVVNWASYRINQTETTNKTAGNQPGNNQPSATNKNIYKGTSKTTTSEANRHGPTKGSAGNGGFNMLDHIKQLEGTNAKT